MSLVVHNPVFAWTERRLAYIPIPKAACSAVKWALREARKLPLPEPWWKIHEMEWPERKNLGWALECAKSCVSESERMCVFTVVRNPWDRLWSCYKSKFHKDRIKDLQGDHPECKLGMSFVEFCEFVCATPDHKSCEHIRSQSAQLKSLLGPRGIFIPNLVIKMEGLGIGWLNLTVKHKLPPLKRLNETPHDKQPPYGASLAKAIGSRYAEDCQRFIYFGPSTGKV